MADKKFFATIATWEVIAVSAISRPRELKYGMKILCGQNNYLHKWLLGKFLLPLQKERISLSQLYRSIENSNTV